jgi:hypothetical protein
MIISWNFISLVFNIFTLFLNYPWSLLKLFWTEMSKLIFFVFVSLVTDVFSNEEWAEDQFVKTVPNNFQCQKTKKKNTWCQN